MSLKKKFQSFEKEFIVKWGEYIKLHDELNLYRGREIGDEAEKVNKILEDIQTTFIEMYPSIQFVLERKDLFIRALADYNRFIDDIKKAGAIEKGKIES
jgi:DNA replication protein DnaD